MNEHEVLEGILKQSSDEVVSYSVTTTPWGSSPSSVSVKAYDEKTGGDVTTTILPVNTTSVSGDVITLSPLRALTVLHIYRVEVKFTVAGQTLEFYFRVQCVF